MSDPRRTHSIPDITASTDGAAERDAKIESLLLAGLDHYFAADYAQAIDVWTRALFLDRNHARARAYIDRARSAMAEKQRESDELLHNGIAAFERGEIEAARQLLNTAVQRGGAHDVALAFLTRIDRISAAAPSQPVVSPAAPAVPARARSVTPAPSPARWGTVVAVLALAALAVAAVASWERVDAWIPALSSGARDGHIPMRSPQDPLIVPRSSETDMERAQALFASGRLYDALRALDLVRATDPLRADADRLKAVIQRELLAHQTSPVPAASQ